MSEMSEIDQVHLRAVMLFMSETSEIVIIFNINPARYTRVFVVTKHVVNGAQCIILCLTDLLIAKTPIAWTRGPSVLHALYTDTSSFQSICRS